MTEVPDADSAPADPNTDRADVGAESGLSECCQVELVLGRGSERRWNGIGVSAKPYRSQLISFSTNQHRPGQGQRAPLLAAPSRCLLHLNRGQVSCI